MSRNRAGLISAVMLALAPAVALAQDASTGIVADRMRPGIGPTTLGSVEGADTTPTGGVSTMAAVGYVRDPIVLRSVATGAILSRPVSSQLTGTIGFEVGLPRGLALRASVPFAIMNEGDRLRGTGIGVVGNEIGPALEAAAGDLMIGAKVALLGGPARPGLHGALAVDFTAPLGGEQQFAATDGPTVAPRLMLDYRLPWITIAVDAQVRFAKSRQLFGASFGDELILAGGVIGRLVSFGRARNWHLQAYLETQGIIGPDAAARPVELRGALRIAHEAGLDVDVGAGGGLDDAVASPRYRFFVLFRAPLYRPR